MGKSLTALVCPETKAPGYHHVEREGGKLTPVGEGEQQGTYMSK